MATALLHLARDIARANLHRGDLPYKVTLVATYHCNFRCEMCSIWQRKSAGEMTAEEVGRFFDRWSQFSWVHLTGGELFMRRDLEDVVTAIIERDRSLYLLNFPTTGWFGDRTIALVDRVLRRGVGRLMTTVSIDGPEELHDQMRGLQGSWRRGVETFRRLRGIRNRNFQAVVGMTLFAKNAPLVAATVDAIQKEIPDFERKDLHLNIGHESAHYFGNAGYLDGGPSHPIADAIEAHRRASRGRLRPVGFLEDRYQLLVGRYYATHKSPLPCSALASSCFIDPYWGLYPCSIWDREIGNLRDQDFDFLSLWSSHAARELRAAVVQERCPHCWTPCEAYPTILGNLIEAAKAAPATPNATAEARTRPALKIKSRVT
jgi:MoaA/NifB/PqqE/SkfB family radical SAM enzyme